MPERADLLVIPFNETRDTENFDCGDCGLNEFLTTNEVVEYQETMAGNTYLVYIAKTWDLVGYYTISGDNIVVPEDWLRKSKSKHMGIKKWGSCMIGRLAVDEKYQGREIGKHILRHIIAQQLLNPLAIRFIRLASNHDAISWYTEFGFQFLSDKEEAKKNNPNAKPRMFFDLLSIRSLKGKIPEIPRITE